MEVCWISSAVCRIYSTDHNLPAVCQSHRFQVLITNLVLNQLEFIIPHVVGKNALLLVKVTLLRYIAFAIYTEEIIK